MPNAPDVVALRCPSCHGPLPAILPGQTAITCPYCGIGLQLGPPPPPVLPPEKQRDAPPAQRFLEAFKLARPNRALQDAIEAAIAQSRDPALAKPAARATIALIADFKRESGIDVSNDDMAVQRIAEAYVRAMIELRSCAETDINLPFLTADGSGPKHYQRTLTRELAARIEA
jgi:hypothetical protein